MPAWFLVFDTKIECDSAEAQITANMGLTGNVTERWNNSFERVDGKWVIRWPGNKLMDGVPSCPIEDYENWWRPDNGASD